MNRTGTKIGAMAVGITIHPRNGRQSEKLSGKQSKDQGSRSKNHTIPSATNRKVTPTRSRIGMKAGALGVKCQKGVKIRSIREENLRWLESSCHRHVI
jgi:hypothetical protein